MVLAILSALAKPARLVAIRMLRDGSEQCVCDLMRKLDAKRSRISRYMLVRKHAGLAVERRDARWVRYRLNPKLSENIRLLIDAALTEEVTA